MKTLIRSGAAQLGLTLLVLVPLVSPSPAAGASVTGLPLEGEGKVEIYLNLASSEVASVFEGTFAVSFSGFDWSFTSPSPSPASSWDFCENATDSSSAIVSCTSANMGGERLVGTFDYTRTDPTGSLSIEWTSGFAAKIDPPGGTTTMPVEITTAGGTVLFQVPEPTTAALLSMGLGLVCVSGARRGRRDQSQ